MKKALIWGLAVVALAAFATSASAITCTIDTRPAATLLVPYFHTSSDGTNINKDTLITVGNASATNTLAHVTVYNHRSLAVLDFNIALTGFDIEAWSMGDILFNGNLPNTPVGGGYAGDEDICQRSSHFASSFYRFYPVTSAQSANPFDPTNATTNYGKLSSAFLAWLQDNLDYDASLDCDPFDGSDSADGSITGAGGGSNGDLYGYVVIDMINYCTLTNPDEQAYYDKDAIGIENNLWGDYILKSDDGIPTYGAPLVSIEADASLNGGNTDQFSGEPIRTFYARYWEGSDGINFGDGGSTNRGTSYSEDNYLNSVGLGYLSNNTYGDMREPLGVRYAARFLDESSGDIASYFRVWRAGADDWTDLCHSESSEQQAAFTFYDEDENGLNKEGGGCPSPPINCNPGDNFPYETQRRDVQTIQTLLNTANGWAFLDFSGGTVLDQAWVGYDFESGVANLNAGIDGTQLDPNNCTPILTDSVYNPGVYVPFLVGLGY